MTAFFRRVKSGETPGSPRFQGKGQHDSFSFKEWENGIAFKGGKLFVSKVGHIKGVFHRELEGAPKTAAIRRQAGKWFVSIACEVLPDALPHSEEAVGIDVGLKTFAALSNGGMIDNPRFFRKDEAALAKAQRKAAKLRQAGAPGGNKPDSENEGPFLPNGASQKAGLNKSIADASWSFFRECLTSKAESASRELYTVDPKHTSQDCHACGDRAKKKRSERWHLCPMCGASLDRDINAAINILNLCGATQSQRLAAVEAARL